MSDDNNDDNNHKNSKKIDRFFKKHLSEEEMAEIEKKAKEEAEDLKDRMKGIPFIADDDDEDPWDMNGIDITGLTLLSGSVSDDDLLEMQSLYPDIHIYNIEELRDANNNYHMIKELIDELTALDIEIEKSQHIETELDKALAEFNAASDKARGDEKCSVDPGLALELQESKKKRRLAAMKRLTNPVKKK